jgi:pyrroline-5-carboxylate reductase
MNERIGIIGFGNMGSEIARALKNDYRIFVFDKDRFKTDNINGITVEDGIPELAASAEILILAVKPQDFEHLLKELKNLIKDKLVISIAAGIGTKYLEKVLGNVRVIRVMPNLGVKIGESVSCICKGGFATEDDLLFVNELFNYIGFTKDVPEEMMDAATAISGSGPGYIFDFIEKNSLDPNNFPEHARHDIMRRLERAAEAVGFSHEDAAFLSANTANSCINMLKIIKLSAGELKKQVASKGGTTEAGLLVLDKGGTWEEAAQAALKRAKELSKGS